MKDFTSFQQQRKLDDVKHTIRQLEALIEVIAFSLVYYFIYRTFYVGSVFLPYLTYGKYVLMLVYGIISLILFGYCGSFQFGHLKPFDVMVSQSISIVLVNIITYFQLCLMANDMIQVYPLLILCILEGIVALICTLLFSALYHRLYIPKNMLMIFGNKDSVTLKLKMDTRADKYHIKKMLSVEAGYENICREISQYDAVVLNDIPAQIRNDILKFCYQNGVRTYLTPKLTDIMVQGSSDMNLFDTPLLLVRGRGLRPVQAFVKRTLDVLLCSVAMIPAAPVMLITALAIKIEDGGSVFFRQKRVTKDGREFDILKFRSMIENAEKHGEVIPARGGDPRITRVGRILRASRLDELPQLLNIIKGDMSIVGPRPERVEHVKRYTAEIPEFAFRTKVKSGLTGYAQIYGKYNTSPYDKLRLDLMYIENYSLLLDIKLVLMTLQILFRRESTEGFEKVDELRKQKDKIITELDSPADNSK